jgi:putative membrane protein
MTPTAAPTLPAPPSPTPVPSATATARSNDPLVYLSRLAADSLADMALARAALMLSEDSRVRAFAEAMLQDHVRLNSQLEEVARDVGLNLPTAPTEAATEARLRMQELRGTAFDRAFMAAMVERHQQAVADTQFQSYQGTNRRVSVFAGEVLSDLIGHLRYASQVRTDVGV